MSAENPLIYNDSMSESDFAHAPSTSMPMKLESIDELSCHLPTNRDVAGVPAMPDTGVDESPILVHTDVLDSVFSTTLDHNDQLIDHTPMFDEMDFMIDGNKVNLKDDWVSLFKDEPCGAVDDQSAPATTAAKEEDLGDLFADEVPEQPYEAVHEVPAANKQLETPMTPALATPVLDKRRSSSSVSVASASKVSKRTRVDHLGVTSYSKKQRSQPLKPIAVDPQDPAALKRARNTEAARRLRASKMERMSQLEEKVEELMREKQDLANEVIRLRELLIEHNIEC